MASVLQQYHQLADRMATQITGSYQSWTDFLTTAARLYKYPYHEQLMIYAQRPDATACAEYDLWNKRMGRYIRRGAKGIALIDHSGDAPRLRYVFDVADTRSTEHSRNPYLWEFRPEHEQVVSAAMAEQHNIQYPGNLVDQLEQISSVKVTEYFTQLEELSMPRKEYHSNMAALPETGKFITEDEIADSLANGSSFEGGKNRIYAFFQNQHLGLTDLFVRAFRKEHCQQQEKTVKPSVRAKLQNQPAKNSPKISANLKGQER